jgi:hypothetical protein
VQVAPLNTGGYVSSTSEDKIVALLEATVELQGEILKVLREEGIAVRREYMKNRYVEPMSQEEKDDLDEDIDLEWWYASYNEGYYPAKYMDRQKIGYSKREVDYMHKRLSEIASMHPEVNGGTHIFHFVGKKYCKAEKNTFNCFACTPKELF